MIHNITVTAMSIWYHYVSSKKFRTAISTKMPSTEQIKLIFPPIQYTLIADQVSGNKIPAKNIFLGLTSINFIVEFGYVYVWSNPIFYSILEWHLEWGCKGFYFKMEFKVGLALRASLVHYFIFHSKMQLVFTSISLIFYSKME